MPDASTNTRARILGGVAFVLSLIGGAVAWAGVNTAAYDDNFHAPVSEVLPVWILAGLVPVCGALGFSSTPFAFMTAAVALYELPTWLQNAYEADQTEALSNGQVWSTYPQSEQQNEATDDGSFGNFVGAYALMAASIFVLVIAFMKTPESTLMTCGSFFERIAIYVSFAAFGALMIAGLELVADDPTLGDDDDVTNPEPYVVGMAGQFCCLGFLYVVAMMYRNSSGGWLTVTASYAGMLMVQNAIQANMANAAYVWYDDAFTCSDSDDNCTLLSNQLEGYSLLAAACACIPLGLAGHAFFVRGGFGCRERDLIRLVAGGLTIIFPIIGFAGTGDIADDESADGKVAAAELEATAGMQLMAWMTLMLGFIFGRDGLGSAFHAFTVGAAFFTTVYSGFQMPSFCAYEEDGCVQGDTDAPMGYTCLWMGGIIMTWVLPNSLSSIICGILKNPLGLICIGCLGAAGFQFMPIVAYNWGDDAGASMGVSAEPLANLGMVSIIIPLVIGATSPDSSRVLRAFTTFWLTTVALSLLTSLDLWANKAQAQGDDDATEFSAEENDYIAGLVFATVGSLFGLLCLAKTGDWSKEEGSSASASKEAGGIETPGV